MATKLVIGIGTSGLRVLEHIQKFHYTSYGVNRAPDVEYLYFETDKNALPSSSFLDNEIKRVYVSLEGIAVMVKNLKQNTKSKWLPPEHQIVDAGGGAGGIRPCGRLAFWGTNAEGSNFSRVITAIQGAHSRLQDYAIQSNIPPDPVVFITGSFTGGTCSGAFIDMAYIVRHVIANVKQVYGLFLLPGINCDIQQHTVPLANTYGALKDLESYNFVDEHTKEIYKETWPNLMNITEEKAPFDIVQFISQDYYDGSAPIGNLNGLFKMAGLFLFLNITGMYSNRQARLVDAQGSMILGKYGTFGLSGIQFPKEQIEDYLGCSLSIELFTRWIDPTTYKINHNDSQPINDDNIGKLAFGKWDQIIDTAFKQLDYLGGYQGANILQEVKTSAHEIVTNPGEDPEILIKNMFLSHIDRNIYNRVNGVAINAKESIIKNLSKYLAEELDKTESLIFISVLLRQIKEAMASTRKYWEHLGIPPSKNDWNQKVENELIPWILSNRTSYKLIAESYEVISDRMLSVFEYMKMHLMYTRLEEIEKYLGQKHQMPLISTNNQFTLPRIDTITHLIDKITSLIRYDKSNVGSDNSMSLSTRLHEIQNDVDDVSIPLIRIYFYNSFEDDVKNAKAKFQNPISKNICTQESLWDYLNENILNKKNSSTFLHEIVSGFRRSIRTQNCISTPDFNNYLKNNAGKCQLIAQRALSPFLSLPGFIFSPNTTIPRFIVASEESLIDNLLSSFRENNFTDYESNSTNKCEMQDLQNLIVFYDERGNFIPSRHLGNYAIMETAFNDGNKLIGSPIPDDVWKAYRKAYIPFKKVYSEAEPDSDKN